MTEHDLQRVLRLAATHSPNPEAEPGPPPDFADRVLARLPAVRFVIPGSAPGRRILWLAGLLGMATATGIGFSRRDDPAPSPEPPSLGLFQPAEPKYHPAGGSR